MYNPNYSSRAIPLVAVNQQTGKYQMTEDSIKFLRAIPPPLGVVSVAGLYRTGKSYLLNRMLLNTTQAKQGFGVGPTINPCTKGLWCWGTPIKGKSQNGEPINIVVIDTEGIGALDQDQTHDTRIFTLAILASSCFIYNSVGSIDENAVQNLSLVVNLTKHIQLKSTNKPYDDQQKADQMAHYFPTFYWVVRDFSLQLQDLQGNTITSKDYLEKALAPLKISSQFDEDVEEKNKIRKLLTSFFKDRDCFTMVRPLVDQTKLQDLDSIPFGELRPEFIQQVYSFRQRVIQGLKIKTLNGKQLSGDMYCDMMSSYVMAINQGAVPNIENAWNYMCQEQCQKIQDDCEAIFDKQIKDSMKFPCNEQEFQKSCEASFECCLQIYRQKAIGQLSLSLKFQKQLKERLKQKIKNLREENIRASKQVLQRRVLQAFNPIMEQLKRQQFKTFEQFQKSICATYDRLVQQSEMEKYPFAKQKYLELYKKVQRQGAEYIFKCMSKEIQNMKAIFKEKQEYYIKQLQAIKNDQQNDRRNYSTKISDLDREKFEMQSKIERLQFQLDRTAQEKQSETEKLSKNLAFKQSEFQSFRKNLQTKLSQTEFKFEELSKNFSKEQKLWQKDRAVIQSKIKQQNITIQELEKEKQIMTVKYEESNNQTSLTYKEVLNRTQKKLTETEIELKKLKQNKFELTEELRAIKDQMEERNEKFERTEKKLKQQLSFKKRELETIQDHFEIERKKMQQQLEDQRQKILKIRSTLTEDLKKQKDFANQISEELRKTKVELDTKLAQFEQKTKFSEEEKICLRQQIEQNKRMYLRSIEDMKMQSNQVIEEREKVRIEQVKTEFTTQIKHISIEFENERKKYVYETEILRNNLKDTELEIKVTKQQLQDEKRNFKQLEFQSTDKIQNLESQLKNLERTKESTLVQKQSLLKKKIYDLESQIEQIKQKNRIQLAEAESKNKECIAQLRITYQSLRQSIESNYIKEKERAQKKYDDMVEEYQIKVRDQIEQLEQDHEQFKADAYNREEELNCQISELKYAVDSKDKDIDNLKNLLAELKATLSKRQDEFSRKFDYLSNISKQEKEQFSFKFEALQQEFNQLQKDLMNATHERQRFLNQLEKTKNILRETQNQYSIKKGQYLAALDQYKRKLSEKESEFMELKINYEKQTALLIQQNQHIQDKNIQLQNELNRIKDVYEEKIRKNKAESEETIFITTEKYSTERNLIQEKYDKNKKAFKEIQSTLNKKLNEMQKQKAVDMQKISNLETKLANLEEKRKLEVFNLANDLFLIKETYKNEKNQLSNDLNKLKVEYDDLNKRRLDVETKLEKEILLLKNQVKNEVSKRQNKQSSLNQTIIQLQAEIDNLHRSKNSQFSKLETNQHQQRIRLEETYRTKITENSKVIQLKTRQYEQLSKKYQYDIKDLRETLAIQRQAKQSIQIKFEKKSNEWQELERKIISELDILKSEREQRGLEFQKQLQKEKYALKVKLNDLQHKLKSVDKEKINLFMDLEKEKARSSQQQSNLIQEIEHLKDKIAKLQKDKVKLDKQNERLKIQKRTAKNASYIGSRTGVQERKSTIIIRKTEKKQSSSEYKNEEGDNKENMISQQMLLD